MKNKQKATKFPAYKTHEVHVMDTVMQIARALETEMHKYCMSRPDTVAKLKLKENNTEDDINLLETMVKAQEINQMKKSGTKLAKAREKFANFNKKRFFTIEKKRVEHFFRLYTKYGGPLSRAGYKTFTAVKLFGARHTADAFNWLSNLSSRHYGIINGIMSAVSWSVEKLVDTVAYIAESVSTKFNKFMTTFSQNKDWIQLKENFLTLVPIIAKMTTCLFNLAKKFIAKPVTHVLKSGLKWTEDIIAGNAPLRLIAFVKYPMLVLVYDPITGKRRDVMKNVKNLAKYAMNAISPPYTGDDLKKCGEDEINEQIFDHVLYSPGEKNVGNTFPLLLDWMPLYKIGDIVQKAPEYKKLIHFPAKKFTVIALSESGRTVTVKPTNEKTYEDISTGEIIREKKFPAKYFKKK